MLAMIEVKDFLELAIVHKKLLNAVMLEFDFF